MYGAYGALRVHRGCGVWGLRIAAHEGLGAYGLAVGISWGLALMVQLAGFT